MKKMLATFALVLISSTIFATESKKHPVLLIIQSMSQLGETCHVMGPVTQFDDYMKDYHSGSNGLVVNLNCLNQKGIRSEIHTSFIAKTNAVEGFKIGFYGQYYYKGEIKDNNLTLRISFTAEAND